MLQPPAQKWRLPIFQLVTHPMFDLFIIVLIILNTVVLAADHHPMDPSAEVTLEVSNFHFYLNTLYMLNILNMPAYPIVK